MAIEYSRQKNHWNYYLSIEQDMENISRYIHFSEQNNSTYSIELARILMAAAQEVDVVLKVLCKLSDPNSNASSLNAYRDEIKSSFPEFFSEPVHITRFGITIQPWEDWEKDSPPEWWTANNKVKHHRDTKFDQANLKNALNAVGALLITVLYYYKKQSSLNSTEEIDWTNLTAGLNPNSSLFKLKDTRYVNYLDVYMAALDN